MCVFQCELCTILTKATISVYPLKYLECFPYSNKLVVSVHYSLVEIKFNQMSITPLNTIIVIIIMKTAPSANQLKQKRKMHFHPPFKIRSVLLGVCVCVWLPLLFCPLKSHHLCMSEQQSGETIHSSTHKNVLLSFVRLKSLHSLAFVTFFLSLFQRFDFSCSIRFHGKKCAQSACVLHYAISFVWGRFNDDDETLLKTWNWIQLSRIDLILSVAQWDEKNSIKYSMANMYIPFFYKVPARVVCSSI